MNENIPQSLLDQSGLPPFIWDLPRPPAPVDALGLAGRGELVYNPELNIADVMDLVELRRAIVDGYVDVVAHDGLYVLKYSDRTMYEGVWNDVTMKCRGLVVDVNGRIVARGWNKFFNLSEIEHLVDRETLAAHLSHGILMPKIDGSLGIAWRDSDGVWRVSTAGSSKSTQARHAQRIMNERYASFDVLPGQTLLVEIVYPDNRIVTDYGDFDDLILLGGADSYGRWVHPDVIGASWPGLRVRVETGDVLSMMAHDEKSGQLPDDFEGWVVYLPGLGTLVKVKRNSYLELHKVKFSLTRREVYRQLRDGTYEEFVLNLPDEFVGMADSWANEMKGEIRLIVETSERVWDKIADPALDLRDSDQRKMVLRDINSRGFHKEFVNVLINAQMSGYDVFVPILRKLDIYRPGAYAAKILEGTDL